MSHYSELPWKVNTPALFNEILVNHDCYMLEKPLQILGLILAEVAERAIELDDAQLNILMLRLALYENGDPYSKEFDANAIKEQEKRLEAEKKSA